MCPPLSGLPLPWEHLAWPEPTILGALGVGFFVLVILVENDRRTLPKGRMRTRSLVAGIGSTTLIVGGVLLIFSMLVPWNDAITTWYETNRDSLTTAHCSVVDLHAVYTHLTGLLLILIVGGPLLILPIGSILIRIWHGAREQAMEERSTFRSEVGDATGSARRSDQR
jgi:hypothetical protein